MRSLRILVLAGVLLVPTLAQAADHATTVAALKDETAECRYLLNLCRDGALQGITDVYRVMEAKHGHPPTCMPECKQAMDALIAEGKAALAR